jgi:hypothetical protein
MARFHLTIINDGNDDILGGTANIEWTGGSPSPESWEVPEIPAGDQKEHLYEGSGPDWVKATLRRDENPLYKEKEVKGSDSATLTAE